jgi:hypothetical protein
MIRGTIVRIGDLVMRYGFSSQLATLECTSSRRSTVMCALPRATALTTEYQRDSSSKRPQSSVVSAARAPTRASPTGCQTADAASRASRPAGGAVGAPGPRARCPTNVPYVGKLSLAGRVPGCNVTVADLTQGHSISASWQQRLEIASFAFMLNCVPLPVIQTCEEAFRDAVQRGFHHTSARSA